MTSIMHLLAMGVFTAAVPSSAPQSAPAAWPAGVPTVQEMIDAPTDVWGAAAMHQPGGPSYEFFVPLLPPLRYVNTAFRHYPIVLAAPRSQNKARYISNGSGVSARANQKPMWYEVGVPVTFTVGEPGEVYGSDVEHLTGPRYERGYLPIVHTGYQVGGVEYAQEAFGPVEPPWSDSAAVFVAFQPGPGGKVTARFEPGAGLKPDGRELRDAKQQAWVAFGPGWEFHEGEQALVGDRPPGQPLVLAILTVGRNDLPSISEEVYGQQRERCIAAWDELLARGVRFQVPEPIVQNAWGALVIGNFMIARRDWMCYSAGNAYDHLYEGESGDSTRALLLYGFTGDARDFLSPLLNFQRKEVRFQSDGLKLQNLANYYWLTRDAEYVRQHRAQWKAAIDMLMSSREPDTGLMPRQNYCGDIKKQVYPLSANANAWRGLRDISVVLAEIGERELGEKVASFARDYRGSILRAVEKSEYRDTRPPFIPNALFGEQPPDQILTDSQLGSYYDLLAPYIIGSGVLGLGSEREQWMIDYLEQHGGIAMGMVRVKPHGGQFNGEPGLDDLYGLRYTLAMLRRDERDKVLVTFYAKLAQGLTRDTFIGGEGTRFTHGDRFGRSMYLPPNSTSNAFFLTMLRYMLVQDWDLDDDGRPDTLRLLYGVPPRWLEDGKRIVLAGAPTAFGKISLEVRSVLAEGQVTVDLDMPEFAPARTMLRVSLPPKWRVTGATLAGAALMLGPDAAVDLTGRTGHLTIRFRVAHLE